MIAASSIQDRVQSDDGLGIAWQEAPCPLCNGARWRTVLEAADSRQTKHQLSFAIVECRDCGLWFTNPRPDSTSMARIHEKRAIGRPRLGRDKTSFLSRVRSRLLGRPCFEHHRLPWHGQGRLLDVNCGNGAFLMRMQDQGWKVLGLDPSAEKTALLRREYGLKGLTGTLPHADVQAGTFDVVTVWTGLELARQPLSMLAEIKRLLTPGGRLYLQVPNVKAWGLSLFGPYWSALDLPHCMTHFSPRTLRSLLDKAGFHVQRIGGSSLPALVRRSLRIAKRKGGVGLLPRVLGFKPINLFWSWLAYLSGGGDKLIAVAENTNPVV